MERYKEKKIIFLFILHWVSEIKIFAVQHRRREKEYYQNLAKREKEKTDIHTEEDLFKRLDELEMEEELEDEIYRLRFSFAIETYFRR